jgi:sensor histidine kinase YesM
MQLHPHFLFNTLHAITTLVRRDPVEAERLNHDLSDLLRLTLADGDAPRVPLARELEILDRYLGIQKVRFGGKLRVRRAVDSAPLGVLVPTLFLQPIVENALRYAVGERYEGGTVEISARREGDRLRIRIQDDGPGLGGVPDQARGHGIGLANTRERLERLYEGNHSFRIEDVPGGGLVVTIDLPMQSGPHRLDTRPREGGEEAAA